MKQSLDSLKVKICCIKNIAEANLAIKVGADAIGLVGKMPSGPGVIDDSEIAKIAKHVAPPTSTFLLTSERKSTDIVGHHKLTNTTTIQIVDSIAVEAYCRIRAAIKDIQLIQVIHVIDESSVSQTLRIAPYVDAILLDSGNPNLSIKTLGGTGKTHDWQISKMIVDESPKPVFLAGGLNARNVAAAIETVKPYGVDLCSSVRTEGTLDPAKLKAFFEAIEAYRGSSVDT